MRQRFVVGVVCVGLAGMLAGAAGERIAADESAAGPRPAATDHRSDAASDEAPAGPDGVAAEQAPVVGRAGEAATDGAAETGPATREEAPPDPVAEAGPATRQEAPPDPVAGAGPATRQEAPPDPVAETGPATRQEAPPDPVAETGPATREEAPPDPVAEAVRTMLGASPPRGVPVWRRSAVWEEVGRFYERRGFAPAWSYAGVPTAAVEPFLDAVCLAEARGLRSADYGLARLLATYERVKAASQLRQAALGGAADDLRDRLAELDVRLSFAWLAYATDLVQGRTARRWQQLPSDDPDLAQALEDAVSRDAPGMALALFGPDHGGYLRLLAALSRYRAIEAAGGWRYIPKGRLLEIGDSDRRVPLIRARLDATGDLLPAARADGEVFDDALSDSVRRFQQRHGLEADGRFGRTTRWVMNVSVEDRIEQLEINLERWRWLPRRLGAKHVIVNVPAFVLDGYEDDASVLRMRVITGQVKDWRTPRFAGNLQRVVFGPYWNVPRSIAVEEILPKVKRNPGWLTRRGFQVLGRSGIVDPHAVDWSSVTADNLPYRFRQLPGPGNAVGQVKFELPNRYSVYLHDTPSDRLFERTQRTFSHGCVRVEQPAELADFLLNGEWPRERIDEALGLREQQVVELEEPVPVYIAYFTAFVDEDGTVNFRRDVYEQDRYLAWKLRESRKWTDDAPGCGLLRAADPPAES